MMTEEEALITEPTHDENYTAERWRKFVEEPKQSQWVWQYFTDRVGGSIKTVEQIQMETTIENYVKTYQGRKDSSGRVEPNIRFEA
jgi:hypothetical protein